MKKITLLFMMIFSIISCEKNDVTTVEKTLIIASEKVNCTVVGVLPQLCFLIKEESTQNWEYFYDSIIGFTYEEGFEYEVLVSEREIENPPQDASSIETTLIKVISKIEKTSENLPN